MCEGLHVVAGAVAVGLALWQERLSHRSYKRSSSQRTSKQMGNSRKLGMPVPRLFLLADSNASKSHQQVGSHMFSSWFCKFRTGYF